MERETLQVYGKTNIGPKETDYDEGTNKPEYVQLLTETVISILSFVSFTTKVPWTNKLAPLSPLSHSTEKPIKHYVFFLSLHSVSLSCLLARALFMFPARR